MNAFFIYLLKVSVGLLVIAVPYYFLLRNDPNLRLKRFFLLGSLILAFLFPLFKIYFFSNISQNMPIQMFEPDAVSINNNQKTVPASTIKYFNKELFLFIIYISGAVVLLFKTLIFLIVRIKSNKNKEIINNRIYYSERNEIYSLFNRIYLPIQFKDSDELETILQHEKAHIRQFHYIDLIFCEIAILFTWFNPFTWLIIRMIKENHEHLADREVLSCGINPAHYRAQLLNQTLGVRVFRLGHSFNHSLTKKRFDMMKNLKSKLKGRVKIILLIPAIVFSLGFLNISNAQNGIVKGKVVLADTQKPAYGASVIIKGTSTGTVVDNEGKFTLTINKDTEAVITFVGYKAQLIKCHPGQDVQVSLEREVFNVEDLIEYNSPKIKIRGTDENTIYMLDGKLTDDISGINHADIGYVEVFKGREEIEAVRPDIITDAGEDIKLVMIHTKNPKPQEQETTESKAEMQKAEEQVFIVVEDMPQFPGGKEALIKFIQANVVYPENAAGSNTKGRVMVQFVVNKFGKVVDAKVISGFDPLYDQAALDVVNKIPDWKPGSQRGKPVSVQYLVPVDFNSTSN